MKRAARGVYFRTTAKRKHGIRHDRRYYIRHSPYGTQIDEPVGLASDGWTVARVLGELSRLQEAKRTGQGLRTLREEREANEEIEQQRVAEAGALARRQRTVRDLWDRYSKEVVAIENKPRTAAEKARMWEGRLEPAIGHLKVNDIIRNE
jgi:hypothetical protein